LRPATGQGGAAHGITLLGFDENDGITETHEVSLKARRIEVKETGN
jgi:hypothetical protein